MSEFKQITIKLKPEGYGQEISFTAERPFRGNLAGYAEFFGGENNLYTRIDSIVERAAKQNGVVKFNKTPEGGWNETNIAETIANAQEAISGYAPDTGGAGVQTKAKNVDAFQELADKEAEKFSKVNPLDLVARMSGRMSPADFTAKYGFDLSA
jgi:hypothetical protein